MQAHDLLRSMLNYHIHLMKVTWDKVYDSVSEEEFLYDNEFSWGSLRNELIHVASVDNRWLSRLSGSVIPDHVDFADYPEKRLARTFAESILKQELLMLDQLSDDFLSLEQPGLPGTYWQVIMQMVNHGTDHRGRILIILNQLGKETFDQDYILYVQNQI